MSEGVIVDLAEAQAVRPPGPPRRDRRRLPRWARRVLVGVGLVLLYLWLALQPTPVVPRPLFLSAPQDRSWFEDCNGRPANHHEVRWMKGDLFWTRTESHTLGGTQCNMVRPDETAPGPP